MANRRGGLPIRTRLRIWWSTLWLQVRLQPLRAATGVLLMLTVLMSIFASNVSYNVSRNQEKQRKENTQVSCDNQQESQEAFEDAIVDSLIDLLDAEDVGPVVEVFERHFEEIPAPSACQLLRQ